MVGIKGIVIDPSFFNYGRLKAIEKGIINRKLGVSVEADERI